MSKSPKPFDYSQVTPEQRCVLKYHAAAIDGVRKRLLAEYRYARARGYPLDQFEDVLSFIGEKP